jgi:hypothetical protein
MIFLDMIGVFYGWEDERALMKLISPQQTVKFAKFIFEIYCFHRFFFRCSLMLPKF